MFNPRSLLPLSPAARRPCALRAEAWRALLGDHAQATPAEPADAWACSSFHASSWDLRQGLDIEEYEWLEAELPPHLEGALQFM